MYRKAFAARFLLVVILGISGCSVGISSSSLTHPTFEESKSMVEASTAAPLIDNLIWPNESKKISSGFGPRHGIFEHGSFHKGVDISAGFVDKVLAAHDGVVIRQDQQMHGFGKLLVIRAERIITLYGHLDDYAVLIGDRVKAGQVIGFVGNTGKATGPHLHFETRIHVEDHLVPVDPMVFFPRIKNGS